MELIKNSFLATFIALFIVACDFVDYEPTEDHIITADIYFQSANDYEAAVIGTYDPIQWMYLNVLIGDIASDNSFSGGETASDVVGLQLIDNMNHHPNNDNLTSIWKWCYEGINRANYLEQNKSKLDFKGKEILYGEVYFLRAYYYFELVKFFGNVPLFTDKRLESLDSGTLQQADAATVYKQIETDLISAISVLPTVQDQKGRVTKYAAQALLGKAYLYQDKFAEAAPMLESVIGKFILVSNYGDQFLKSGENGTESVFEIQYTNTSEWWDWGYTPQGTEGNFGVIHNGPRAYEGPEFASGWSFNIPSQELYDSFEDGDSRRGVTILDIQAYADQNDDVDWAEGYKHTGYFNRKYIPRAGESGAQIELNYGTNYRAIRYADVLLMAAEAYNRGDIDDGKAQRHLNEVRRRAFGDTAHDITETGTALTEAIWKERNFELAMEGHRFFDLVRTGKATGVIEGFEVGKHELFPIPQQEMDISGFNQNPNY